MLRHEDPLTLHISGPEPFLPHGHLNWFALIWSLEQQPFSKLSENRKYSPLLSMTTDVLFFYGVIPLSPQFLVFISINIPPLGLFLVLFFGGEFESFKRLGKHFSNTCLYIKEHRRLRAIGAAPAILAAMHLRKNSAAE